MRIGVWLIALLGIGVMAVSETNAQPLEHLRWHQRVIVIIAERPDDPALVVQQHRLDAATAELLERDVTTIAATEADPTASPSARDLRAAYAPGTAGFQVALIGKDGGVKLLAGEPVATNDLFVLIDSMPMRQREMRER